MYLKIYAALGDLIENGDKLYFSVGFKNPGNNVNARIYTYKHKDTESYSYEQESVTVDNTFENVEVLPYSYIKTYS